MRTPPVAAPKRERLGFRCAASAEGVSFVMTTHMMAFGNADALQNSLGLSPSVGQKVAAIIAFSGAIEHYLERAIWKLRNIDPDGIRPVTDSQPIAALIAMLDTHALTLDPGDDKILLEQWAAAARNGFTIRHNIAHGVPSRIGEALTFMRNSRWQGELRRREFGDFWADESTLDLVRQAMAVLLKIVFALCNETPKTVASEAALRAVRTARSVLGEFASRDYNPTFEKY